MLFSNRNSRHSDSTAVMVNTSADMGRMLPLLARSPAIAVDTEGNSRYHYPERVSLVQLAIPGQAFVVDPLAQLDVASLSPVLEDPGIQKVFHGADYDLRGLNRDWGLVCHNIYDTSIAARFAGVKRFGLMDLAEELLGVSIAKSTRLQRSDWSRRPLSHEALEYAIADVVHLIPIRDALDSALQRLGRQHWVAEEFQRLAEVRYQAPDPEQAFLSAKGSSKLDSRGLAVLKKLWDFREGMALRVDRHPSLVLPDSVLVHLAGQPHSDLASAPGISAGALQRLERGLKRAIDDGLVSDPVQRLTNHTYRPPPTRQESERLARLKRWRVSEGERLDMDPSLLWPMRSLERLAREPTAIDEEMASPLVRGWQAKELGIKLKALLSG